MKNKRFEGKKKIKYIAIVFVVILMMTLGYSMLKETLNINGSNKIKKNSWIIYFDNVDIASDSVKNDDTIYDARITNTEKNNIQFSANLKNPGDFYEFTVYTVNDGSIDASVSSLEKSVLTEEQSRYLDFDVTYDDGTEIKRCDILYHKNSTDGPNKRLVKAVVKFKDDLPLDQYPTTPISLSLFFKINYEQNTDCDKTAPSDKHKLTIDPTGGIYNKRGAPLRIYLSEGEEYTLGEATRELYNFKSWKVTSPEENGTYTFENNKFTMGSEDVYISAEWIEGDYVARIMNTYYKTVQEAFDAANGTWENNTVYLLKNVTESPTNNTSKPFIFDLNGKTVTGTITNSKVGNIDLINGTVVSETAEAFINKGILLLGEKGLPMNTENSVRLIGKTIGLKNVKNDGNIGEFYFYDGYIEGDIGIVGGYTNKEDKYYVFAEHLSEKDTQRVYLIRNPNRAVAKTLTEGEIYYYNLQDAIKAVEQNKAINSSFTDNDYIVNVIREFEAAYEISVDSVSRVFIDTKGHDISFGEKITNDGYLKLLNTEETRSKISVSQTIQNNKNLVVDNLTIISTTDEDTINNKYAIALFDSTIQGKNGNGVTNEQSARINMDNTSILTSTNGYGLNNKSNNLEVSNGNIYGINNTGTITLKDDVKVHNVNDKYAINNSGTVNINGGEVTDTKDIELIKNNGIVNVNDGLVSAKNTAIKDGTININGGEVISTNGPTIYSSNVTVNDGTVSSEEGTAIYSNTRNGKAVINGGTINGSTYGINTNQITINGGTITGNTAIKDYRYINPNNSNDIVYGTTTITGGTITGVNNGIISDNLTMSNATVNSTEGIGIVVNKNGTILSGTVEASTYGIDNKGIVTLGNDDKNIVSNNPSITGELYGLYNEGTEANFYDGQLIGKADSHHGEITGTPTGGSVFKDTETIGGEQYQKEYVSNFADWLQVGDNTYNNLDEASEAVSDNGTIIVTRDVDITFIQKVLGNDKNITLDLNGKVITSTQTIENEAILTIIDSSNNLGAINPRRVSGITNNNKLTIENGTYYATSNNSIINNGEMIINNANVKSKESAIINNGDLTINNINLTDSKIGIDNNSSVTINNANITVSNIGINNLKDNTSVKVNGGNITATNYGIYGDYGDIDITNGTITSTTNNAIYTYFGTIDVDGGNITSQNNIGILSHNNVTINNGTITGTIGIKNELYCPYKSQYYTCSYKTITVNDGHVIGTTGDGINMTGNTSTGKINIYGGTIEGKTNGVYTTANTQIGKDDNNINIEKPELIGHTNYGLKTLEYTAFYDGILKGVEDGYDGLINIIPHASLIDEDYEYINKREYQTDFLVTKGNFLKVGNNEYNSINTAYQAIEGTEGTITVIKDAYIDFSQQIPSGKNVTLDLNGHSLIMTQPLDISGNVTIINESTSGGINNISDIAITNSGTTIIKGGTINSEKKNTISNSGNLTIDGANITSTTGYGIYNTNTLNVNSGTIDTTTKEAIYSTNNTIINNGTIIANNSNCITIETSNLTVNDGNIESKLGYGINVTGNSNIYIKGGNIIGSTHGIMDNNTSGKIEISGGHITGTTATGLYTYKNTTITGGIVEGATYGVYKDNQNTILNIGENDGTINIDSPVLKGDQYGLYIQAGQTNFYDGIIKGITDRYYGLINSLADNAQIYEDTEVSDKKNYLTDYLIAETEIAININKNKQYGNLQTAFNEANSGDTIELLTSVPLYYDLTIANNKNIILDLKGNTISANKTITNNGKLTITNTSNKESSIKTSGAIVLISNKNDLTINNIKLINNNADNYVIVNDSKLVATNINVDSINGINSTNDATINNSTIKASKIALNNTGKLVINNGNYIGTNYSIYSNSNKDVNITGATLNGNFYNSGNNEVIFSTGIINNNIQNNISKLTILNSTINRSKITNNGNLILEGTTYKNILGSTSQSSLDTGISNTNKLTLDNSNLIVNDQEEGKHSQLILNTGELNIINNSKVSIGMNNSSYEYRAITNQGSGEVNIESSEIDALGGTITYGIYNNSANASATILSGKIDVERATTGYGVYNNNGTFTMGHYEGSGGNSANVSTTNPLIYVQGNSRGIGVKKINGSINFYDGIIKASKFAKPETTTNVEYQYEVTTYVDDETNFEYALLEFMGNDYQGDTVALLNGVYYKTVQDAIDKCEEGYTITLLKSVSEDLVIPTDKHVTLNLNKHSITTQLTNSGTFIVYNGLLQNFDKTTITNHGTLIMGEDDGRVSGSTIRIISENTTIVNDGTFKMYDGYIEGKKAIEGEITEIASFARLRTEKDEQTEKKYLQSLSEASIRNHETDLIITINPNYGTYNGSKEVQEIFKKFEETYTLLTPTKKGCIFDGWDISDENTLSGSGTEQDPYTITVGLNDINATAKWIVDERAVARIGEDYYFTLREAFDEAQDGDTVQLIKNVTESATTRKKITLDLATYTITGQIINLGDLRVINGTINNPNGAAIDNRRNLILGDNDGEMIEDNVKIIGKEIGIEQGGRFDFYDGYIEGDVALSGKVDNVPKGYFLYNDFDTINNCQKVYLIGNPENAVAETRVGGTQYYFRLQDAINTTALTGYEIFIRRNFEATYALDIPNDSNIVINTNGNDFSVGNDFNINGNLKIYNPSFTRTKISSARTINNDGTLLIDNVDIEEKNTDAYAILNNGNLTVKDSKVTTEDNYVIYTNGELSTEDGAELISNTYAVYNNQTTPLTLTGGTIYGIDNPKELVLGGTVKVLMENQNLYGINMYYNDEAKLTMNGGEITTYNHSIMTALDRQYMYGNTIIINDGKITSTNGYAINERAYTSRSYGNNQSARYANHVTINGGEFKGKTSAIYNINYNYLDINGGYFTTIDNTYNSNVIYCNNSYSCNVKNATIDAYYMGLYLYGNSSDDTTKFENLDINLDGLNSGSGIYITSDSGNKNIVMNNITIKVNKLTGNGMTISSTANYVMNNIDIDSKQTGISISGTPKISLNSGTIKGKTYGINISSGTLNIGTEKNEYSRQNPYITGGIYGVYNSGGIVNFYNGSLRGSTYGYYKTLGGLRRRMKLAEEIDSVPNYDRIKTITTTNKSSSAISNYAKQGNGYARLTYIGETNDICQNNQVYNFSYTGATETYTVPCSGKYKMETWGAGTSSSYVYGGYSYGEIDLVKDELLYITVGGSGSYKSYNSSYTGTVSIAGGFNGGGSIEGNAIKSNVYIYGPGGATHIATMPGLLKELENNKDSIIMVAGGSGSYYSTGWGSYTSGSGGGYLGGPTSGNSVIGGSQEGPGINYYDTNNEGVASFGQGGNGFGTGGNAGGGGYYGGAGTGSYNQLSGGGSGYVGNSRLSNTIMYGYNVSEPIAQYTINYLEPKETFLRVGTEEFSSFEDAVEYIENEGTIVVIKDAELTEEGIIPEGKNITLDINNKQLTTTQPFINNGTFTIKDNSNEHNGTIINSVSNFVENKGTLNIDTLDLTLSKYCVYATGDDGTVNINDSNISASTLIYTTKKHTVNINNVVANTTSNGISLNERGVNLNIKDSTIKSPNSSSYGIYSYTYNSSNYTIGTIINVENSTIESYNSAFYGSYSYSNKDSYTFTDSTLISSNANTVYTYNNSPSLTFNNCDVISKTENAISLSSSGILTINGGTYIGKKMGITTASSSPTINVISGRIEGKTHGIDLTNSGPTLNIGSSDKDLSLEDPIIIGTNYGVNITSGTVNFYNGILKGRIYGYNGTINYVRKNHDVVEGTDVEPENIKAITYSNSKVSTAISRDVSKYGNGAAIISYLGDDNGKCQKGDYYPYNYKGSEETFVVPCTGKYSLEVWGAGSQTPNNRYITTDTPGGYSYGEIELTKDEVLYINVGGQGTVANGTSVTAQGGYNGGGDVILESRYTINASSGGGATHIALKTGLLSSLVNDKDKVLIVAGGAGGSSIYSNSYLGRGGAGGGYKGNPGTCYDATNGAYGTGGTQTSAGYYSSDSTRGKGSFGQGGSTTRGNTDRLYGGAGGGGWYGGGAGGTNTNTGQSPTTDMSGGGGGSGYIGHSRLSNAHMTAYNVESNIWITNYLSENDGFLEVDGVKYDTFAEAIEAVNAEGTIKVIGNGNVQEPVTFPAGKNITLDLNNKTVTLNKLITNNTNLHITDLSEGKNGTLLNKTTELIANNKNITVDYVSLINKGGSNASAIRNNVANTTITLRNNASVEGYSYGIYNTYKGTINISDSKLKVMGNYTIYLGGEESELNIINSEINGNSSVIYLNNQGKQNVTINGCTINTYNGRAIDDSSSKQVTKRNNIKIYNSTINSISFGLYSTISDVDIKNTTFNKSGQDSNDYAIMCGRETACAISENTIVNTPNGSGIYTETDLTIDDTEINSRNIGIVANKNKITLNNVDINIASNNKGKGISLDYYDAEVELNNTNIYSKNIGIYVGDKYNNRKVVKVNSGNIVGEVYGIYQGYDDSLVVIGNENNEVSITNPYIEGGLYSVYKTSGKLQYYSGKLKGYIKGNPESFDVIREGYEVYETTDGMQVYLQKSRNRNTESVSDNPIANSAKKGNGYAKVTFLENVVSIDPDDLIYENVDCEQLINKEYHYLPTKSEQEFTSICSGIYKLEVWGAQGSGNGGYASGYINLKMGENLKVYVGTSAYNGGFNGGGTGPYSSSKGMYELGGGATDIRLNDSLYSRIIVAGGGGGSGSAASGGAAGGETGSNGSGWNGYWTDAGKGGSQTAAGGSYGSFGQGGSFIGGAGGGGWYGGGASSMLQQGGGGGSSYAVTATSSKPSGYLVTEDYYLTDTKLIGGNSRMPSHDGNSTITGNLGDGYAKITYVGKKANAKEIDVKLITSIGTLQNNTVSYSRGDTLGSLETPSVDDNHYIFKGWYIDPEFSQKVTENTVVTNSMTLYAKFIYSEAGCNSLLNHVYSFDYTGGMQTLNVKCSGKYKLEVWGAQGGNASFGENSNEGGYGAYSVGEINLNKNEKLYIGVGGQGQSVSATIPDGCTNYSCRKVTYSSTYGYNGGGYAAGYATHSSDQTYNNSYAGGGGATHIATSSGTLRYLVGNEGNLLIVAGGGGGAITGELYPDYSGDGGHAGGLNAHDSFPTNGKCGTYGSGATSEGPGKSKACPVSGTSVSAYGQIYATFGLGSNKFNNSVNYYSGGGGGYYGGSGGYKGPGGGGTGYIGNDRLINKYMYAYDSEDIYMQDYSNVIYLIPLRETIYNKTLDRSYKNLQLALNEARNGDEFELRDDTVITYDTTIFDDLNITLDLNGYTLKTYKSIVNDGGLTIVNNGNSSSKLISKAETPIIDNNNILNISNIEVTGNYAFRNNIAGEMTFDGISIEVNKIGIENNGKMTLTNSSVTGDLYGIYSNASSPEIITNCTLSSQLTAFYKYSTEKTTMTNTNINGQLNNAKTNAKLVINGGTITKTISNSGDTTLDTLNIVFNSTSNDEEIAIDNNGLLNIKDSIITHTNRTKTINPKMDIITINNTGTLTSTNTKYTLTHTNSINKDLSILNNSGIVNSTNDEYTVSGGTTAHAINNSSTNTTNVVSAKIKVFNSLDGYGIYSTSGSMRMTGGSIESYESTNSGGVYVLDGNPILDNVTVTVHDSEEKSYGAYIEGGKLTVETGKLKSSGIEAYGAYITKGTLTLGIYDGRGTDAADVSTTNPYVEAIGTTTGIGIRKGNGSIEFFDGYVTGSTSPRAQGDIISATDLNYEIVTKTDEETGYNYEIPEFIK